MLIFNILTLSLLWFAFLLNKFCETSSITNKVDRFHVPSILVKRLNYATKNELHREIEYGLS